MMEERVFMNPYEQCETCPSATESRKSWLITGIFYLDLAVCFVWMLVVWVGCRWWDLVPAHFLMVVAVVERIMLSFSLHRREKRSWIPLTVFTLLFVCLAVIGNVMISTGYYADLPLVLLGTNNDRMAHTIIKCTLLAWLFLGPLVVYVVGVCRKTLKSTSMSWKDALGAMLWKDRGARTYCQLMLVATGALYAGLDLNREMCRLACLVLSPLSFYLIATHVTSCRGTSKGNPLAGKLWLMVAAMALFFYAYRYMGMLRVCMLVASLLVVAYVCWLTFGKQGAVGISLLFTVYLGILLPALAIGYNPYVCIAYRSWELASYGANKGYFTIHDLETRKVGLRDRFGMLIEPTYESIYSASEFDLFGDCKLRKNGYVTLYNVRRKEMKESSVGDPNLQDNICQVLDDYCDSYGFGRNDRLEVRVTRKDNPEEVLAHVMMKWNGSGSHYDYSNRPFISADSVTLRSGEFATGSPIEERDGRLHVLLYSYDVKQGPKALYHIDVKTARKSTPQREALVELAKKVERLLNQ